MNHRQGKTPMRFPSIARITNAKPRVALALTIPALTIIGVMLAPTPALAAGSLVLVPDAKILITLLVIFVLLISPINHLILLPLIKVLDDRAAKINGARERAQHLEQDAEISMDRYRDAIRQSRENSEAERQAQLSETRSEQTAMTADAKNEAASEIARARSEIEASLGEARASLRSSSEEVAKIAAEQILGRALT